MTAADGKNTFLFDDPNNELGAFPGAVALGGVTNVSGGYNLADGFSYNATSEVDVVVAKHGTFSTNATTFIGLLTHEVGHTLGFRHSDGTADPNSPQNGQNCTAPSPCASPGQAIMAHIVNFNMSSLQQWDLDAANTVYGSGPPPCIPVSNVTVSANPTTISPGGSSQLSATATGTSPSFKWFMGPLGNTSNQISTSQTLTVSPTVTTTYWAQATNSCSTGPVNSATSVTVTVQCNPPTTANAMANPTNVVSGGTSTISVAADGTGPLTYQLVQNSTLVGSPTTSSSIVTPPLTSTSTFFVNVTNACSTGPTRSNTVTVTVTPCTAPTSATASANPQSIVAGNTTQLFVGIPTGTAPFNIQWFSGFPPGGTPITGANSQTIVQSPSVTTTYYAQITNACGGPINSASVTVTVSAACTLPSNAVATANPASIQAGQTSNLSVTANGTGLSIQWFTGTPPGGTAIPGATSSTVPVTPATTTTYFARVTGQCGTPSTIDSNAVTVTVAAACVDPSITTQPGSQTIIAGTKATLKVVAAGTVPLHYQWFEGVSGDTSKPVGTDSTTFITPALTKKTQYWVQVRGNCTGDKRASSATATIDVKPPRGRPVGH